MAFCKQCKKWMTEGTGKRKKEFCNETCRSNFWYAKNKKGKAEKQEKLESKIRYTEATHESYNGKKTIPINDEPLSFDKLRQEVGVSHQPNTFYQRLSTVKDPEELQEIGFEIERSALSWKEKMMLRNYAQQIYKSKFDY